MLSQGRFAQVIEGSELEVHRLSDKVRLDARYQHIFPISECLGPHRWFGDWPMALGQVEPIELNYLLRAMERGQSPLLPLEDSHVQTLMEAFGVSKSWKATENLAHKRT
ncbi:BLUF domain-containing protein [Hymenobacter sp. BT559]|uniref:BLUF domain-containing protein n=1 Tax=Hymenobacter sp. BT559 TaxID=2795729 RepID=UPI0018EDD887|nr:BLUF domain-containing protein [Hymenobacter sp. BT559]